MTDWKAKATASLVPLSEAHSLAMAIAEWYYSGTFFDYGAATEVCELCEQQNLKYHFEILNRLNGNRLDVGSECIKRFDLTAVDELGNTLDAASTARLVDKHRRTLVEDARQKRVMTSLIKVGQLDESFQTASFLEYVDGRGAFTPKQVAYIFWRFSSNAVSYKPSDYKVSIRRDREKNQLRTMTPAALKRVLPALTAAQKKSIQRIKDRFEANGQRWR